MAVKPILDATEFRDDVAISELDLDASFREQASLFASYAAKHFEAQQQAGNKKIILDITRSKTDRAIRDRLDGEKGEDGKPRKYTEAVVTAEILRSPVFINALKEHNESEAIVDLLRNALEAFKQRKDMLISLGANQRQEKQGEVRMSIGAASAEAREVDRASVMASLKARMAPGGAS